MKTREIDKFGEEHVRLRLDPQILVFDSEAEEHFQKHGFLFKVELSNSELRWILTKSINDPHYYHWHDKGFFMKTLCMGYEESIKKAKEIVGPDNKIFLWEETMIINPSPEHLAFDNWFSNPNKQNTKKLEDSLR